MRINNTHCQIIAVTLLSLLMSYSPTHAQSVSLLGAQVSLRNEGQVTPNSELFVTAFPTTVTVSDAQIEFPNGLNSISPSGEIFNGFVSIAYDVGPNHVDLDFSNSAPFIAFASRFQNTAVLTFDAEQAIRLTRPRIDFGTTLGLESLTNGSPRVTVEQNQLRINYESLGFSTATTARIFFDVGLLGDFDNDGDVDGAEVDFYIGNLGQQATGEFTLLDLDGDGDVTIADHNLYVTTLVVTSNGVTGALLGDVDLDGTVDVLSDAFALVGSLGQSVTSRSQGDLNADGVVDVLNDAFILVAQLGQSNEP